VSFLFHFKIRLGRGGGGGVISWSGKIEKIELRKHFFDQERSQREKKFGAIWNFFSFKNKQFESRSYLAQKICQTYLKQCN
jgi:hypothetical protein